MSQLTNLIKKSQFAIDKNLISEKEIKYFFENDPTPNKNMAKFMCYVYINNQNIKISIIRDFFDRYNELGKLKDKYNFKLEPLDKLVKGDFSYFREYIRKLESDIDKKIKEKEKNKQKTSEYKILDENSEWVAVETLTVESNQKFGSDSDWCTRQSRYFNHYSNEETKLVIFINKKLQKEYTENQTPKEKRDPEYKFQAQIKRKGKQIKNKTLIDCKTFLNLLDEKSKNFSTFDDLLNKTNMDLNKLVDSTTKYTKYDEIIDFQNIDESEFWLLENISNLYLNKQTGLIDCETVFWDYLGLTSLPKTIKLGVVTGSFNCRHNQLISLEGSPYMVEGHFKCDFNNLKSLKGISKNIQNDILCNDNKLTSLEGIPKRMYSLNCSKNPYLTSLKNLSNVKIGGDLIFSDCNVEYIGANISYIGRNVICSHNKLKSLKGLPSTLYGMLQCSYNKLTNFESFPSYIYFGLNCRNNPITSVEGNIKEIEGTLFIDQNKERSFTKENISNIISIRPENIYIDDKYI